ncbi:ribonuclease III, bacterial [Bacteroidales bacterium 6E]|nr:ribonuclease III, bacterial [Bacteroidales bacterium 6E]
MFIKDLVGFYPGKLSFYDIAFTHRSASRTDSQGNVVNNERLEYLGDAILGAVIADFLYNRFPQEDEGFLTKMRSKLVNRSILTNLTYDMGLNVYIDSNATNAVDKSHIYGDALEALIGAIYLDRGYDVARYFIIKRIIPKYIDLYELEQNDSNFKSKLIEWSQKTKRLVRFETLEEYPNGSKQPKFISIVIIDNNESGKGTGNSKKEAQQNAARDSLSKLGIGIE